MDLNIEVIRQLENMTLTEEVEQTEVVISMPSPLLSVTIHYIKVSHDVMVSIISM